jgi:hypothetical protein
MNSNLINKIQAAENSWSRLTMILWKELLEFCRFFTIAFHGVEISQISIKSWSWLTLRTLAWPEKNKKKTQLQLQSTPTLTPLQLHSHSHSHSNCNPLPLSLHSHSTPLSLHSNSTPTALPLQLQLHPTPTPTPEISSHCRPQPRLVARSAKAGGSGWCTWLYFLLFDSFYILWPSFLVGDRLWLLRTFPPNFYAPFILALWSYRNLALLVITSSNPFTAESN